MLYPFSLTLDLYIQAESFEEAKKLAEAYVQDASLDTTDYPEIVQDVLFGKHLKNWIWMLVMPHGFTSPAAATTASTIWGSTYAIVDQNIR